MSTVLFASLTVRIIDLQVVRHSHFVALADAQRKRSSELLPHRGNIYVREGQGTDTYPVASNKKVWIAYTVPRDIEDPDNLARALAPELVSYRHRQQLRSEEILERTGQLASLSHEEPSVSVETQDEQAALAVLEEDLRTKFQQESDPYEPILKPHEVLDDELHEVLKQRSFRGVVLEEKEIRTYPEGELMPHVLGYVGFDEKGEVGRYGIEGFFDDILKGDLGWLSAEKDALGKYSIGVAANDFRPAEDGSDIALTIDRVVQAVIKDELVRGVKKFEAERGSVVVMNPRTGAILGMATHPSYDPNVYYAVQDPHVQINPVVSEIFEPGSILKPVIMAIAVNEQVVTPETTMKDSGPVRVDKYTINTYDGKHYGIQTMTEVLEKSNNIGMVWVAQQIGAEMMYDYLRRFGLGERTGIELDGETQTNIADANTWNVATVATVGFGQGIALTPIQALTSINTIAHEGILMRPYIVDHIRSADGSVNTYEPSVVRRVISEKTASQISAMMVSVIENGVAGLARVPGYYFAGKTGTAQVPDERGKYFEDRKIISFVGFGPVPDPQFSILIKLDNPAGLSLASGTAAPMFRAIAEKLVNYYQIPPSYDEAFKQPSYRIAPS